jgi:hypothetical protein
MLQIAQGVLFAQKDGSLAVKLVSTGGKATTRVEFAKELCSKVNWKAFLD